MKPRFLTETEIYFEYKFGKINFSNYLFLCKLIEKNIPIWE